MKDDPRKTSLLLDRLQQGDQDAESEFFRLVEKRLRAIAQKRLGPNQNPHTLGVSGVMQEALLRMIKPGFDAIQDSNHFFGLFSRVVQQVVVSHARLKNQKRGGNLQRLPLLDDAQDNFEKNHSFPMLELQEELDALKQVNKEVHEVFIQKIFGGYTMDEIAEAQEVSKRTVERRWQAAKAWLYQRRQNNPEKPEQ